MKATKLFSAALAAAMMATLCGCGEKAQPNAGQTEKTNSADNKSGGFDGSKAVNAVTREDGSGTRGAFIELFGIEQKNEAGEKVDMTTDSAAVADSTAVMMTTVAGDPYSIGYVSLGTLNDTVKAVKIDGAAASAENIKNGSYKISRPFNIITKGDIKPEAQDFIDFILSADGQAIIADKYIPVTQNPAYGGSAKGKIVVEGSSSVTPVMEKLKEGYIAKNPDVTVEIQQDDSSTGITNAIEGTCDIGMSSRELKASEIEKGAKATLIATDGVAVIVNKNNPADELSSENVKNIFTGAAAKWSDVK